MIELIRHSFSAHADQALLLEWLSHFENPKMQVYVIHGEPNVSESFASLVTARFGFETHVPAIGEVIALSPGRAETVRAEPTGPEAEQLLSRLAQKTNALQGLLAASPPKIRDDLWARVEADLARAEARLDAVMKEAGRVRSDD